MPETHTIRTVEATDTNITRECSCGWAAFADLPEPAHHIPLAQREAKHLRDAAAIEDGTVWLGIPDGHVYRLHLRHRLRTGERNHVVVTAVWQGGSQEVLLWPWTADGLAQAQGWCDKHPTTWRSSGHTVLPGSLACHARG